MAVCSSEEVVICEEIFNDLSYPTPDEIAKFSKKIGINLQTEYYLVPLAKYCLLQRLPSNWIPCFDRKKERHFYFNVKTRLSQWEHPLDNIYLNLVNDLRDQFNSRDHFTNSAIKDSVAVNEVDYRMLPLRANRKPQLVPIEQLLKKQRGGDRRKFSASETDKRNQLKYDHKVNKSLDSENRLEVETDDVKNQIGNWLKFAIDESRIPSSVRFDIDSLDSPPHESKTGQFSLNRSISEINDTLRNKTNFYDAGTNQGKNRSDNQRKLSGFVRNKSYNPYNADSAVFSASNVDDTSKNIASDFTNSDTSSNQSSSDDDGRINKGSDIISVTVGKKLTENSSTTKQRNVVPEELNQFPEFDMRQIKNEFCIKMDNYMESLCEKFTQEQKLIHKNQEKLLQKFMEDAINQLASYKSEIIETVNKNQENCNNIFALKETLSQEMRILNRDMHEELKKSLNESVEEFQQRIETKFDDAVKYNFIPRTGAEEKNSNFELLESLRNEIKNKIEMSVEDIRQDVDKKVNGVRIELFEKLNLLESDVSKKYYEVCDVFKKECESIKRDLLPLLETFLEGKLREILPKYIREEIGKNLPESCKISYDRIVKDCSENLILINSLPVKKLTTQDVFSQTGEIEINNQEEQKVNSFHEKMNELLKISNNVHHQISELTKIQGELKCNNSKLDEKCSSLEEKFSQLLNLTDMSISNLRVDVPNRRRTDDCGNRLLANFHRGAVCIPNFDNNSYITPSLSNRLEYLNWRINNYNESFGPYKK